MDEYFCRRCNSIKEEKEFWKVYKEELIDSISEQTKQIVKSRGNIQQYCKKCCQGWFKDNKWRIKGYTKNYMMKKKDRELRV